MSAQEFRSSQRVSSDLSLRVGKRLIKKRVANILKKRTWFTKDDLVKMVRESAPPEWFSRFYLFRRERNKNTCHRESPPIDKMVRLGCCDLLAWTIHEFERRGCVERHWSTGKNAKPAKWTCRATKRGIDHWTKIGLI